MGRYCKYYFRDIFYFSLPKGFHFIVSPTGKIPLHKQKPMKKYYGKFVCDCGRLWFSSKAFYQKWQKCKKCDERVTPRAMVGLPQKSIFVCQKTENFV